MLHNLHQLWVNLITPHLPFIEIIVNTTTSAIWLFEVFFSYFFLIFLSLFLCFPSSLLPYFRSSTYLNLPHRTLGIKTNWRNCPSGLNKTAGLKYCQGQWNCQSSVNCKSRLSLLFYIFRYKICSIETHFEFIYCLSVSLFPNKIKCKQRNGFVTL